MVGLEVKERRRGGGIYRIVGEYEGGYVLQPLAFGRNQRVTSVDLQTRFGVEASDPAPVDEQQGWRELGAKFDAAVERQARSDHAERAPTPEEQFARISDGHDG
jgi:hypothetical protein